MNALLSVREHVVGRVDPGMAAGGMRRTFPLGQEMRVGPGSRLTMPQETAASAAFHQCDRTTDDDQRKNENNKCLHPFDVGMKADKFKKGVAPC